MDLNVDKEGFLREIRDWNKNVAAQLATSAGIELTDNHWEVIDLARSYYQQYNLFPANRVLVHLMSEQLGEDKGSSIYLMQLFTGKPRRYIAMISGLPKPSNCD